MKPERCAWCDREIPVVPVKLPDGTLILRCPMLIITDHGFLPWCQACDRSKPLD